MNSQNPVTADSIDLIQFMHMIISFHFIVMIEIKIFLNVLLFYQ